MDKITLKNFRCFREEQTARLAPLTLLVGENSTGKTSFMALIRALWDVAFAERVPDFREPPYNLGSFRDIVHNRGGRGKPAESFEAGFEYAETSIFARSALSAKFEEHLANPFPFLRRFEVNDTWAKVQHLRDVGAGQYSVTFGGKGIEELPKVSFKQIDLRDDYELLGIRSALSRLQYGLFNADDSMHILTGGSIDYQKIENSADYREALDYNIRKPVSNLASAFGMYDNRSAGDERPFASAPVRSRPLRTYDPASPWADPEGEYVPTYLASIYHRDPVSWQTLKGNLENFGHASGLFDEISIKSLGGSNGMPFQLQIRKFAYNGRRKGPQRNLIDVGYGVSQALPLLTELLRTDARQIFLLQQPEVHLHPRAQAALGSLFCAVAGQYRQLIVETHSEYLIDRVRIDIRDKKSALTHEDVSILYFEPGDLDVKIHSIRFDEYGNVLDAPPSYGKFFMEEVSRSIGIGL